MKKILFLFLLLPFWGFSQSGTWPTKYSAIDPSGAPSTNGTRIYFNTATNTLWFWEPAPSSTWRKQPKAFDQISGCAAPAYTPTARQSTFAVNSCSPPELYQYTGSEWECLNCSTGGGTNIYAGAGITLTGSAPDITITADDSSPTNEIQTLSIVGQELTLSDGGGTVTIPTSGGGGPDSTFVKTSGVYTGKRITDNVYKNGTLGLRTTDTTGIINIVRPLTETKWGAYFGGGWGNYIQFQKETGVGVDPQITNFNIGRAFFSDIVNSGDNQVVSMGFNVAANGTLEDPTQANMRIGLENNYRNSISDPLQFEIHIPEIRYPSGAVRRPFSGIYSNDETRIQGSTLFANDRMNFYDYKTDSQKAFWTFAENSGAKGISFLDTAALYFYKNNEIILQQRNAANNGFIPLLKANTLNEVELSPSGNALYTTANTFKLLNGLTIQPNNGDDIRIGSSATESGALTVWSSYPLWARNAGNNLGFAWVLNTHFELRDMSTSAAIMTIQNNAPADVIYINSNGGLGVGGSPVNSAKLEVTSTTKGFLPPRMTTAQRNAISSPATGLTLYCTDCTATDASTGVMQTYNGTTWKNNW